jgi:peroxiredoxin
MSVATKLRITLPLLSDKDAKIAEAYGVMRWAMGSEPGHTFVLVDQAGRVAWIKDYGGPENGGLMYVPPPMLIRALRPQVEKLGP